MRDTPTLHTLRYKKSALIAGSIFHSHGRFVNNENNSYPKTSVKWSLACSWVVHFTSADKNYIW
jgi:hypothetical protein